MPDSASPLLRVDRLNKSYNIPVLRDFDFDLQAGEVHALVGGNGAGKSTFARILAGLSTPDSGAISMDGMPLRPSGKRAAERAGVVMVLQELNVFRTLSVAENLFLDRLPGRHGFVRRQKLRELAQAALERVGLGGLDPETPASRLGIGQQQLIEIAAALARKCRVLILDEPTAALTDPEIECLFAQIRRLQAESVGIIYISHRMDEIRRIAGRVTVLRDGCRVATHPAASVSIEDLVREMAGHDLPARDSAGPPVAGAVALRVQDLHAGGAVRGVSFEVCKGEILGLAGLIGSGRTETLRAIFGADRVSAGNIRLFEGPPRRFRSPAEAVAAGLGMVPEDRKQDGLLLPQPVHFNLTLGLADRRSLPSSPAGMALAGELCERTRVRGHSLEQPLAELSGGNQQKVLIARWLARDCGVLMFDEPTRGIDAAAKDHIHQLIRELAAEGRAIVIVSSEMPELMALSHRIAVMSAGRIVAGFSPGDWSPEAILHAAFSAYNLTALS